MYNIRVWSARKMFAGCREAVGSVGLVRPCGSGSGESGLGRTRVICRFSYLQLFVLCFREELCEDLTFRRCRGGVGRGSRVGGQDWD